MSRSDRRKVTVTAASADVRVPMEGAPRRYITHEQPVTVTSSPYYRRQIRDGDLVVVKPKAKKAGGEK